MLEVRPGPDPYVFYKMHHVDRARSAWALSEELGLYEALRDGPATIDEVAARLGIGRRYAAALLAANACMGILGVEASRYAIYPILREFVLDGGRSRTRPRTPDDFWYRTTLQAIRQGGPVDEAVPDWVRDPHGVTADAHAFSPGRHGWRVLWGQALAEAFDFSPYRRVLDLGGATGGVLVGLTGCVPGLQGVLMELPYSRATAEAAIAADGAAERVSFWSGDFFTDPYPADVDVIFMSHIVHDWDDAACLRLLRRCHDALPPGGPVLVQEFLLDADKTGQLLGVFQWFGLLNGTTGDQRTAAEIGALLEAAGFTGIESRPVDREQSLVIGWR